MTNNIFKFEHMWGDKQVGFIFVCKHQSLFLLKVSKHDNL